MKSRKIKKTVHPKPIQKLIDEFSKFPAVGPRAACRFAYYLRGLPDKELEILAASVAGLKKSLKTCLFCFRSFEPDGGAKLCGICRSRGRDRSVLCLVEKETDLISLEKAKTYQGLYFVLEGIVAGGGKKGSRRIKTRELVRRIKNPEKFGLEGAKFGEIILGLNPTAKGEAVSLEIKKALEKARAAGGKAGKSPKITRLGRGLPLGGELEYADPETLKSAVKGRE